MKIALACGGTGGHIFPGLATATVLRARGHEVTLWLAGKDVEGPALRDWTGPVVTVPAEGLPSGFSLRAARAVFKLLRAGWVCRRMMRSTPPDVLLAMGSYASVGPVAAALMLDVPVVLHEANVIPGRAVRLFARRAAAVAASFEETRYYLRRRELVVTGLPIRAALEEAAARLDAGARREIFTLLVMGGSRGAHRLNEIVAQALSQVHAQFYRIRVIHLAGVADEAAVRAAYAAADVPADVRAFAQDMAAVYASVDLAICRSGAATCAELRTFRVPALLVPYPFAAGNHQMYNARAMEKLGVADVVPEDDLRVEWLADYVAGCIRSPERLTRMQTAARAAAPLSGAAALADLVVQAGQKGGHDR